MMQQDDERQDIDKAEALAALTSTKPSDEEDDLGMADKDAAAKAALEREADAHEARSEVA